MDREQILLLLNQHRGNIQRRFAVKRLALFGSAARNEMNKSSDIDVLVEFEGPATFDGYMDLKFYLEDLFKIPVDLVTERAIKPRMRPIIQQDLIYVS